MTGQGEAMELLKKLSVIDAELAAFTNRLVPFRTREKRVHEEAALAERESLAAAERLQAARKETRELEQELALTEEKKKAELKKIDAIRSVKAAQAAEHEMSGLLARLATLEEKTMAAMEAEEAARSALATAETAAKEKSAELAACSAEITQAIEAAKTRSESLIAERQALATQLPAPFGRNYFSLLNDKKLADPIVTAAGESCPGCRAMLKPNFLAHLRAGQAVTCDQCKRIILPGAG